MSKYLQSEHATSAVLSLLINAIQILENSSNIDNNRVLILRARTARKQLEK